MLDRTFLVKQTLNVLALAVALWVSWPFLASERAGAMEVAGFLCGLLGGLACLSSKEAREGLKRRASQLGQERGFPMLDALMLITSPAGALVIGVVARLLSFPAEVAFALAGPYAFGSLISIGLLVSYRDWIKVFQDGER